MSNFDNLISDNYILKTDINLEKIIIVSDTEPSLDDDYIIWYDPINQHLYLKYNNQWIDSTNEVVAISDVEPDLNKYTLWVNTAETTIYANINDSWVLISSGSGSSLYIGDTEPSTDSYSMWFSTLDGTLYINIDGTWVPASSTTTTYKDELVKASATDPVAGYLDSKVDNETIEVVNNKLSVRFQDDQTDNVVWSSNRISKESIIKAIIFG